MYKWLARKLTKNYKKIPLIWITFNLNKYRKDGAKNSCMLNVHPSLGKDYFIIETLEELTDYIRDNYDMEDLI